MNHPFLGIAKIVKTQSGSASRAYAYITRSERFASRISEVEYKIERNYPSCCHEEKNSFWKAGDGYERTNGTIALAIVATLPPILDKEERSFCVERYVRSLIADRHAVSAVIHNDPRRGETSYPHLHLLFSPRIDDGVERPLEQFFSRSNPSVPQRGGAPKETFWSKKGGIERIRDNFLRSLETIYQKKQQVLERDFSSLRATLYEDPKSLYTAVTKPGADERANEPASEGKIPENKVIELSHYHQRTAIQRSPQETQLEVEKIERRLQVLDRKRVALGLRVPINEHPRYTNKLTEDNAFELASVAFTGREWCTLRREYQKLDNEFGVLEIGLNEIYKRKQELGLLGFFLRREQYRSLCEEEKHCYRRLKEVQTALNKTASRVNILHAWLLTHKEEIATYAETLQKENQKERSLIAQVELETYRLHQRLTILTRNSQLAREAIANNKSKQREDRQCAPPSRSTSISR